MITGYFLFYYAFAHMTFWWVKQLHGRMFGVANIDRLFKRFSAVFRGLPYEHKKNVVMCKWHGILRGDHTSVSSRVQQRAKSIDTMNVIFTAIALALQLAPIRWAFGYYALWQVKTIRTAAIMVSSLYVFELLFRFNMRYPL
jgi:hypothetical protein